MVRHHPDSSGLEESSSSNLEEEKEGQNNGNEEDSSVDGKEGGNAGNEAAEGYDDAKGEVLNNEKGQEVSAAGNEENFHDVEINLGNLLEEHMQLPVVFLARGCSMMISDLMEELPQSLDKAGQTVSSRCHRKPWEWAVPLEAGVPVQEMLCTECS
ncbi:hypothetical protein Nmel_006235 [Mimus melanotis]